MFDVHVIGAGGHAQVVIALAEAAGYRIAGVYDDRRQVGTYVLTHPIVGNLNDVPDNVNTYSIIAIGDNTVRKSLSGRWKYVNWLTLIHPTAWVAPNVIVGEGSVIMAGAIVQPNVQLGRHVIINTLASVDHECVLADFVHVAPGCRLAGNVQLEQGVFGGIGSLYTPGVKVGCWSVIGAGATVIKSLPSGVTAVGVPAKIVKVHATT